LPPLSIFFAKSAENLSEATPDANWAAPLTDTGKTLVFRSALITRPAHRRRSIAGQAIAAGAA
jgi:hypothetical protein